MSECNHDCSSCSANCGERTEQQDLRAKANVQSNVKKVIAVVSGKGGVGKSMVTSLLAVALRRMDLSVGVLDADITGPSIPKAFGVKGGAEACPDGLLPAKTKTDISLMSVNLLLPDETDPVIWRGPVIAGTVTQFWTDVCWGDVDVLLVDMPPGTGDVPLTVFQSLPIDGIVVITSPQELVGMIVQKAMKMADMMNVPVLGVVENMSYISCPDCGKKISVFGESKTAEIAASYGTRLLAQVPIQSDLAKAMDKGSVELADTDALCDAAGLIASLLDEK